jgi:hypothetical protein
MGPGRGRGAPFGPVGVDDPFAYRTAVDDLIWSVQRTTAPKGRAKRLEKMIPALRDQLRSGLRHIDYPTALTEQFFSGLDALYQAAIEAGQDPHVQAAAAAAEAAPSAFADDMAEDAEPWLAAHEAAESGYVNGFSMFPVETKDEADPRSSWTLQTWLQRAPHMSRNLTHLPWTTPRPCAPAVGWSLWSTVLGCGCNSPGPRLMRPCSCSLRRLARRIPCRGACWSACTCRGSCAPSPSGPWSTRPLTKWLKRRCITVFPSRANPFPSLRLIMSGLHR